MNAKKFSDLRDDLYEANPESRRRVAEKTAEVRAELALADLRAHRSRTQAQLADAIGTTQSAISRLERQPDVLVSTLSEYIEATGGRLRLVADFGDYDVELDLPAARRPVVAPSRERTFEVVWQNQQTRQLVHIGRLRASPGAFKFEYTPDAELDRDFQPFPDFPDLRHRYEATSLFPFFERRVASAAEPGYDDVLSALGLDRDKATPVELLGRSWGQSTHDTIQIVPEPEELSDGTLRRLFLVSGASRVDEKNPSKVAKLIARLKPGQRLDLHPEPDNPVNPHAIMIVTNGRQVGWMPNYLLDEVRKVPESHVRVYVERANGPTTPWHLRLLCRLDVLPDSA
jgi:transcriptional regulator with XRE-family HTH domain